MLRVAPVVDTRSLFEEERAELVALVQGLEPEAASRPTACPGWTVKDLAAHVLGGDVSLLARLRDSYVDAEDPAPPLDEWDAFVAWLDARNQSWVEAMRPVSPAALADLLVAMGASVRGYLGGMEVGGTGEVVSWAGTNPAPNWLWIGREFTERWIHQQQIRDALGKPGLNGPRFVTPVLAILMRAVPHAYRDVDATEGTTVAILVEGRAGRGFAVRREADGWQLLEGREKEVDATLTIDQETAWRYLVRSIDEKAARKVVTITGDKELAEPFFGAIAALVRKG